MIPPSRITELTHTLEKRIVILDGAMGTNIQKFHLEESDYRGEFFANREVYPEDLKNNNDILVLTRPDVIQDIHHRFLTIGQADIIETCTFGATSIGQHDYFWHKYEGRGCKDQAFFQELVEDATMRKLVQGMNLAAVNIARQACDDAESVDGRPRYVAGSIGPMPVTCSL
ncbi:MAG: homocysteine S-methyltransferase family protein, partial [Akkermansia sp.]